MLEILKPCALAIALGGGLAGAAAANCGIVVLFENGQGTIGPGAATTVANYATANPNVTVAVNGYTDATGDPRANRRLSERRAQSVAEVVADSAGAQVVSINGIGEAVRPDTSGPNDPRNRRVEVVNTACRDGLFGVDAAAGAAVVGPGTLGVAAGVGALALLAALSDSDDGDDDDSSIVSTPNTP